MKTGTLLGGTAITLGLAWAGSVGLEKFDNILVDNQEGMSHPFTVETTSPQTQYTAQYSGEEVVIVDVDQEAMIDSAEVVQITTKSPFAQVWDSVMNNDDTKGVVFFKIGEDETVYNTGIAKPLIFDQS